MPEGLNHLDILLAKSGLARRGAPLSLAHHSDLQACQDRFDEGFRSLVLIGHYGASHWPSFAGWQRGRSAQVHPLDRWTEEVLAPIARQFSAALDVFDTRSRIPVQALARRAEGLHQSPLGLLIHPEYGLWHAWRAALWLPDIFDISRKGPAASPCETCSDKPCLMACPVDAFALDGFDYVACQNYLNQAADVVCLQAGCDARNACPIGAEHQYPPDMLRFHMRAFKRG